jgi:hypothetical protein
MARMDVIEGVWKAAFGVPISALLVGLVAYVPVVILLWIFVTGEFARIYGVYISLVIGAMWYPLNRFVAIDPDLDFGNRRQFVIATVVMLIFWAVIAGYKTHVELVQKPAELKARIAAYAAMKPLEELCRDIGVRYGRSAAKALQGQHFSASADVIIPERCRNDPSTAQGVKIGTRMQLSGE